MVRMFCSLLLSLAMAMPALADDLKPFEGARPLAMMMATDPWLMVIGSDTPNFVLYEDGQVVYRKALPDRTGVYMSKQLAPDELAALKAKLAALVPATAPKKVIDLMPNISDQPESRFFIDIDGKGLVTSVVGLRNAEASVRKRVLPPQIAQLHALLSGWDSAGATPWVPKYIEAMVWDYDYAPGKSIQWPAQWPGLNDPLTIKRSSGYSLFLPGTELPKLMAFLKTANEKGAVDIGGKKWAVSVRYVFPGTKVWSAAFRD
jgi:hypothetical protein